jgi:hypothetical protein
MMSGPQATPSPQVQLVVNLYQGFKKKDVNILAKYLHKDFRYTTHPKSLGKPELTRDEWLQESAEMMSLWASGSEASYVFMPTSSYPH